MLSPRRGSEMLRKLWVLPIDIRLTTVRVVCRNTLSLALNTQARLAFRRAHRHSAGRVEADAQPPRFPTGQAPSVLLQVVKGGQATLRSGQQLLSQGGQASSLRPALKERSAQMQLKFLNALAQSRLRQTEQISTAAGTVWRSRYFCTTKPPIEWPSKTGAAPRSAITSATSST